MEKENLLQKLLSIRKSVEYIQKTEKGNQGAMYVDPAVLLKTIRDKMNDIGILLYPSLDNGAVMQIESPTQNNQNAKGFLFTSDATYTFCDSESGESLVIPWFVTGKHGQDSSMAQGGGLSYSERYFILKFFQIPTAKDDPEYFESKTSEKISEKHLIELTEIIEGKGYKPKPVMSQYCIKIAKIPNIEALPDQKFESARDFFSNMDEKQ